MLLESKQLEKTILEKDILLKENHQFLVDLKYLFQSQYKIYFVEHFMQGGDLRFHLNKGNKFKEEHARFYVVQIAIALGHLHSKNIVYRDLKPENILVGLDGYLCLTDFGLAKVLQEDTATTTFCGTPNYLAPEILNETGHTFTVDWWTLGILTYEMIVG